VCVLGVAAEVVGYFGSESAGQCPSCEQGLPWIAEGLRALDRGTATRAQLDEITSFAVTLPRRGACAMPDGAIRFLQSVFTNFPEVVEDHLASGCSHVGETTT
jgi:NADH:ubiquinone oxidoreductase subunit F (NADH-binding)